MGVRQKKRVKIFVTFEYMAEEFYVLNVIHSFTYYSFIHILFIGKYL